MKWHIVALITGLVILVFLFARLFMRGRKPSRYPYQRRSILFSLDDQVFFRALQSAIGANYEIFGKISVSRIIAPKKGTSDFVAKSALKTLEGRHFDFILCEKPSLSIACAVQLHNKSSHEEDPLMQICASVGLPYLRFAIQPEYSIDEIRENVRMATQREPLFFKETGGRREPRISNLSDMNF